MQLSLTEEVNKVHYMPCISQLQQLSILHSHILVSLQQVQLYVHRHLAKILQFENE